MNLFACTHCGHLLYFENNRCEKCHYPLGFEAERLQLLPLEKKSESTYTLYGEPDSLTYTYCANHARNVCNWLVPTPSGTPFCRACSLNHTIPDLSKPEYVARWRTIEEAKHRLVYTLLYMKLPLMSKAEDQEKGLMFDFVADESKNGGEKVLTGHADGLITLNIAEADDIEREMARKAMDELYRTVLGHFRHEVGHYYWDRLIADSAYLPEYRRLFGDERADYGEALQKHYDQGPPADWRDHYISSYATMHSWEDWAETWAHYLHLLDTLQTAHAFGLRVAPGVASPAAHLSAEIRNPYQLQDFGQVISMWLPLTFAMNSLNRSMGLHDPYPFVIRPEVQEKLAFIHRVCQETAAKTVEAASVG